jgi:TonB family protein
MYNRVQMVRSSPDKCLALLGAAMLSAGSLQTPTANGQTPAIQKPAAQKPAEQCIAYREMAGSFQLFNECDFPLSVAWCSDATPLGGECGRKLGWQNARVEARGDVPGQFAAGQAINLFACLFPKTVEIILGGSGRCETEATRDIPAALPIMPAAALKNPAAVVTASDYPSSDRNKEGTTKFEMTVGADGRPVSCAVTTSSGHSDLDSAACRAFLKRARFSPAKDLQGNPIPGRYRGTVTWKAP